jgi:hypothetical protein
MSRHPYILLASVMAILLSFAGTFQQSVPDPLYKSFPHSRHSFLGSICASFSSLDHYQRTLIADVDHDSEDSTDDEKDGNDGKGEEDGTLKDLWDSVLLG